MVGDMVEHDDELEEEWRRKEGWYPPDLGQAFNLGGYGDEDNGSDASVYYRVAPYCDVFVVLTPTEFAEGLAAQSAKDIFGWAFCPADGRILPITKGQNWRPV